MTKDIIYIIKRVIIGVLISLILMFIGSLRVHAKSYVYNIYLPTQQVPIVYKDISGLSTGYNITNQIGNGFRLYNSGSGYITTTLIVAPLTNNVDSILSVEAYGANKSYLCELSAPIWYTDNQSQRQLINLKCPFDSTNNRMDGFNITRFSAYGTTRIAFSDKFIFTPDENEANNIINGTNQAIQQQIQNDNINTQNIINGMSYVNTTITEQGNRAHQDAQDIKDSITDDSAPTQNDIGNNTSDWSSNNANNGVINQLLTMPITLINSIVNGLSNSCSPYNFGSLFGTDLILPCVDMSNILGSLWTLIDVIISGIFIFLFGGKCVRIFNDFTNLKGGQVDTLYGGGN